MENDLGKKSGAKNYKIFFIFLLIIIAGVLTGYVFANIGQTLSKKSAGEKSSKKVAKVVGVADKKTFKDTTQGILKEGGFEGEGSFHLERPGGKSQNVYLTSSTVDLSEYIGKKIKVRGETFKAEKAGWLMDVGLVEVIE